MAYTTSALVKTYLGISSAADDTLLGTLIVRGQAFIDKYVHRTFEVATATAKRFDSVRDVYGTILYFTEGLELAETPTVVTNGDNSSLVLNTDYVTLPVNSGPFYGLQTLESSSAIWVEDTLGNGQRAIAVTGKWGYSVTAPDDIVHAATRLTAFLYRQREGNGELDRPVSVADGMVLLPARLPADIAAILEPYRRNC